MENTVTPATKSTDESPMTHEDQTKVGRTTLIPDESPMTYDDVRAAFEEVELFTERALTLVESALELSEQKGLPYGLMAETMNVLGNLVTEVIKYKRQIKQGIVKEL